MGEVHYDLFRHRIDRHTELRQVEEEQAVELSRLVDRNREHLREWLPWVDDSRTTQDSRVFLREVRKMYRDSRTVTAGIWHRGRLSGMVGLNDIDWVNRSTRFGYWLDAGLQGQGIMTRACKALVEHVFADLELNRIEIEAAVENVRSRAIPERLGFQLDGVRKEAQYLNGEYVDLAMYGMTAGEWHAREQKPSG